MTTVPPPAPPVHTDRAVFAEGTRYPSTPPAPHLAGFLPSYLLRMSAERLRDEIDLAAGVISQDRFDQLDEARINTMLALAACDRCDDPDDLDPWDWPSDDREYESADAWPDWTDCPIPYYVPELDLAVFWGSDHDAQPDPFDVEANTIPDWEYREISIGLVRDPEELIHDAERTRVLGHRA